MQIKSAVGVLFSVFICICAIFFVILHAKKNDLNYDDGRALFTFA